MTYGLIADTRESLRIALENTAVDWIPWKSCRSLKEPHMLPVYEKGHRLDAPVESHAGTGHGTAKPLCRVSGHARDRLAKEPQPYRYGCRRSSPADTVEAVKGYYQRFFEPSPTFLLWQTEQTR
ncbi:MAG: hypothetical protein ACLTXT_07590 [Ruminococcus callidus]